ncbi:hypothetical protein AJ80_04817 [Polytolypa hystricis UAMH7299]|uniref:Zn(2)-C6 fungal-type domain-containing protein n=1 Tax=Polytolypa hystricis (strain UAMH7299) TaxID=1447883 RepID=A0A2B7YA26_POLH7|nr:hypothetical protein AJ80_04817 [Polytolypa hystricis UAMH7299]
MSSGPIRTHKRAYQACNPCRERRVRCDLGSVDAPAHGPCSRCRRERKVCEFSATRGKKKTSQASPDGSRDSEASQSILPTTEEDASNHPESHCPTIKTDVHFHQLPPTSTHQSSASSGGDKAAEALLRDTAYTYPDALKLLWEAGRHSERVKNSGLDTTRPGHPPSHPSRSTGPPSQQGTASDDSLRPWSNLRFVRTGLFTAEEALDLVSYFHTYLAPFTPISSSSFQDPSMHARLLEEEPVLATTILMLASRYMKLSGPGAISRSYMIHERLWQHLQGMISRMIFGQEQFTASSNDSAISTYPPALQTTESALAGSNFGSLRTLGTCEALLLLSEWHPRSLHVAASDDGDSIVVKDEIKPTRASTSGIGGRIRIDWLEPVWRSDRMCWSMLGNALALAVELGIFDEYDNTTIGAREARRDIWNCPSSSQRAYRVQHLLWVYLTQTSGRLGWKNLTSVSMTNHEASTKHGDTIRCWVGVASLMKRGNELLFPSRERTREIIKNGEYLDTLRRLNPILREWQQDFDRAKLSKPMRSILSIEYCYVRVYINSVALPAVVENLAKNADSGTAIPISTMLNPYEGNTTYFMEVVAAAKSMLQTVVEDLLPDNHLKHIPIRTYSRILAGAMFCLKAIALGIADDETAVSLSLVEQTAEALCTCVVDDLHLSNRFGELLQALAASLRSRVVRTQASEMSQSGNEAPANIPPLQQHYQRHDGGAQDMPPTAMDTFDRQIDASGMDHPMIPRSDYEPQRPGNIATTTPNSEPALYQMPPSNDMSDPSQLQNDALINFAGLDPNQLGWSGGQDFFDMLGPLLDVQYEYYR